MRKKFHTVNGFTLVEVLVSVALVVLLLPFAASMLTNSQLLASYSKHKIQAAYAAQQIIETQRQQTFMVIAPGPPIVPKVIGPESVILDTKGNYSNIVCGNNSPIFCGTATITVTPAVYTNSSGVTTTSTTVDHFVVQIKWNENIAGNWQIPMTETYAADVANDPMLN